MSVTRVEIKKIAELARLEFNDDELENYTVEMNKILEYVEQLKELDTTNVKPLSHPIENNNVFREDIQRVSVDRESALKNAPESSSEYFKVPKVISQNK